MKEQQRLYKFSTYLKERYGCPVYKVSIDAGFSCPNKDGRLSTEGCIYCDNRAFSFNTRLEPRPIEVQIEEGMKFGKKRYAAEKFIVYFQAYTNTYAPINILKERYDIVRKFGDIVGISIGTRPDCVNEEILDLVESYSKDYEAWIEYGLQSIHDKTLKVINRNHTYKDFLNAYKLTRKRDIKVCVHVIIGLPGESKKDIIETAKELGRLKIDAVKIHPMHVVRGTKLEKLLRKELYKPLEFEKFIELTVEFLKELPPDTMIQRIGADCPQELLVAPSWILDKNFILSSIYRKEPC